ncbi:thioredoxin domain-containing protein [Rhodococcus sp. X156]|uniref:DsbA family protein n=1 Tax=Rhodococcus sp. X156 TaxID=2499145 RepID=UPI0019D28B85|nr:thioredoxin domain-containing protein [Rhodococcus sp. X156]
MSSQGMNKRPVTSKRSTIIAGVVLALVAVVVIGGVVNQSNQNEARNEGYGHAQNSPVQVNQGVVRVGSDTAPVTIDIYEDYLCPVCAQFEKIYGQELAQATDEGKIAVRYHSLDFLNDASASKDYSTRAAAAALCVATTGDGRAYPAYHATLFDTENQPAERAGTDLSNDQLAELATQVGASAEAGPCITSGARIADAQAASQAGEAELAAAVGAVATPTVLRDGKSVDFRNTSWVSQLG